MSKVRIVQVLCPSRHCIKATAYESQDGAEMARVAETLKHHIQGQILREEMIPRCGICGSGKWIYEDQPTIYKTMEEALPYLLEYERRQRETRDFFKASRG